MSKPLLLDLFCGAGGAAMGYHRAGFRVVGVDHKPQPHYPFEFILADAMTFPLEGFDAIHASPPCQGYSIMRHLPWLRDKKYPLLIEPTRELLLAARVPYVIENVTGARRSRSRPNGMQAGWLCGGMFDLPFYRHRYFESDWFWMQPGHPRHRRTILAGGMLKGRARVGVYHRPDRTVSTLANSAGAHRSKAEFEATCAGMGIDWMTRKELSQAIPPAYTEYIGRQLISVLKAQAVL